MKRRHHAEMHIHNPKVCENGATAFLSHFARCAAAVTTQCTSPMQACVVLTSAPPTKLESVSPMQHPLLLRHAYTSALTSPNG